ncbi:MAG TPA: hypothetical protein DCY53_01905 [Desulfobacteraceae bacterium]|jgi:hypothetical protein|nr:hypothetical protein [Desulfobacteraceae bacterium]
MEFLLRKLIRDVTWFYDQYYKGDPYVRCLHLVFLEEMFNPERFKNTENLAAERVAFLTEVQEEVDKTIY